MDLLKSFASGLRAQFPARAPYAGSPASKSSCRICASACAPLARNGGTILFVAILTAWSSC